ncbi:MAG: nucleoside-diphosphate sugar epimerase/dehydratase [Dethiobacteria bacterium]
MPLFKKGKVFIWGAGSFGELVNNILKKYFLKVEGYIDSDPQKYGSIIGGFRVFPPKMLRDKGKKKILVASQPGKYAIAKELEAMGYKHIEDYVVFF